MKSVLPILMIALLSLAGCNLGNSTGYVPTKAEIEQIKKGVDSKESLNERFGRPTIIGESENAWYYIASKRKYPGSLPTREIERRILVIGFNGAGRVIAVEEYSLASGRDIDISRYVTATGGRELSLWEQLRGNIGNFSAEDFLSRATGSEQ